MADQEAPFTSNSQAMLYSMSRRESAQIRILVFAAEQMKAKHFVDIGANIGAYTSVMARKSQVEMTHSFEASPGTYQELAENIRLQGLGTVTSYNIALSDREQVVEFLERAPLAGANAIASTANKVQHSASTKSMVACKRLDDILLISSQAVVVKLDVEGHEANVLEGARNFIEGNRCCLQIEFLNEEAIEVREKILTSLGYQRALYLHNDYYYLPADDQILREALRDFSFSTFSDVLDDYLAIVNYASSVTHQVRQFKASHPEYQDQFPRVNFPMGKSLFH